MLEVVGLKQEADLGGCLGMDAQRKALQVKPVKNAKPFAPTIRKVTEFVQQNAIPKLKPPH